MLEGHAVCEGEERARASTSAVATTARFPCSFPRPRGRALNGLDGRPKVWDGERGRWLDASSAAASSAAASSAAASNAGTSSAGTNSAGTSAAASAGEEAEADDCGDGDEGDDDGDEGNLDVASASSPSPVAAAAAVARPVGVDGSDGTANEAARVCSICLEALSPSGGDPSLSWGQAVCCEAKFHYQCLCKWLQQDAFVNSCPHCRRKPKSMSSRRLLKRCDE